MSTHLDDIINKQHGSTSASVVFIDVSKYSLRKSIIQQRVIQEFNRVLGATIDEIGAKHISESQKQNLNFSTDVVKIPTGDGSAIVFPFQGFQAIHLDFALAFLSQTVASRDSDLCEAFEHNGWCNCHSYFNVRIGLSDGKVIVFRDINGNYNIAGNTINIASRVMNMGDPQQIMLTGDCYRNLIDMTEDTSLEKRFAQHGNISVKHNIDIEICQYIGHGENYISRITPMQVQIALKKNRAAS